MNNKMKKAAFLLDEVGNVSDVYLQEALAYKKARFNARPWVAAVACILAVVIVGGGLINSPLVNNILGGLNKSEAPEQESPNEQIPATLDSFLSANRETLNCTATKKTEITYFGSTYLVLQYEGDEMLYRSRDLTDAEVNRILDVIDDGASVGAESPELLCRVWLVCEDGTVLSPYLKNTPGNRGQAVLFDYEAEILPSFSLISCISDILK